MADKTLISIATPVYNEEDNIDLYFEEVDAALAPLADRYAFEFVFTDNHSTDGTFEKLRQRAERDDRIRILRFSRNFGFQKSILTGYLYARGHACIQLDCDLQDPPALIPEMIRMWEQGYHVVYGIRRSRVEGVWLRTARRAFYRLIDYLSEYPLPRDAGDFRLLDREILEQLRQINDQAPYLRGIISELGFRQIGLPYDRRERQRGKSKFSLYGSLALALDGIIGHSIIPLRLATLFGLATFVVAVLMSIGYVVGKFMFGADWRAGFATTTVLELLSISLNALLLGVIGEYLGRVYKQVRARPLTIVANAYPPELVREVPTPAGYVIGQPAVEALPQRGTGAERPLCQESEKERQGTDVSPTEKSTP